MALRALEKRLWPCPTIPHMGEEWKLRNFGRLFQDQKASTGASIHSASMWKLDPQSYIFLCQDPELLNQGLIPENVPAFLSKRQAMKALYLEVG